VTVTLLAETCDVAEDVELAEPPSLTAVTMTLKYFSKSADATT
jgi:hypothetical protein